MKDYQVKAEYARISVDKWSVRVEGKHLEDYLKELFEVPEDGSDIQMIGSLNLNLKIFETTLESNVKETSAQVLVSDLQLGKRGL